MREQFTVRARTGEAERVVYGGRSAGVSFQLGQGNAPKLPPPLATGEAEVENAIGMLEQVLRGVANRAG